MNEDVIILILKQDKDPNLLVLYCLISLLNLSVKILAEILALRLVKVIQSSIKYDQTGFICGKLINPLASMSDVYMAHAQVICTVLLITSGLRSSH